MLRKAEEHFTNQRQHEAENLARLETARRIRQEERDRQNALEVSLIFFPSLLVVFFSSHCQRQRMEELRTEAEKLAEERRIARERAMEWTREVQMESDEERERKSKKAKKPKGEIVSGDEGEPKKKRRGKLKKATSEQGDEEHSEEEETEKPAKKVSISLVSCLTQVIDSASANSQETSCS